MPPARPNDPLYRSLAQAMAGQQVDLSDINGERLLSLAQANGAAPLLAYRHAKRSATGIDRDTAEKLAERAREQAARDLVLNHATRILFDRLADAGLRCLALKGTPLSLLAYSEPYLRERCDSDLYVGLDDVEAVAATLREAGYALHGLSERPQASKQFQASIRSFQALNSIFDIHYRLSNRVLFRATLPFEDCWEARQPISALGPSAQALSNPDLLLHACIHRIAHGRGSERNRLIWLYDIHLLWNALDEAARQDFVEKALTKKIGAVCADAIEVCYGLFGTPRGQIRSQISGATLTPVSNWLGTLQQNASTEPSAPLIEAGKLRWAWADLMAIEGLRPKLAFARELVFKG